jgi:UDP-glucose 6-dehydrogenase
MIHYECSNCWKRLCWSGFRELVLPKWEKNVTCVDIDEKKNRTIETRCFSIYDPGLKPHCMRKYRSSSLHFTRFAFDFNSMDMSLLR